MFVIRVKNKRTSNVRKTQRERERERERERGRERGRERDTEGKKDRKRDTVAVALVCVFELQLDQGKGGRCASHACAHSQTGKQTTLHQFILIIVQYKVSLYDSTDVAKRRLSNCLYDIVPKS